MTLSTEVTSSSRRFKAASKSWWASWGQPGACPTTRGKGGRTPLHVAAGAGSDGMATTLLVRGAEKDARDDKGGTPLLEAARSGHSGVVDILMAAGADVGIHGEQHISAVVEAACEGHVGVFEVFVKYGVDVTAVAGLVSAPLHMAATTNQVGVIDFLIKRGADIEAASPFGYAHLLCAAHKGSWEAMRSLLSHGAAVDAESGNPFQDRPLHIACRFKRKGVAAAVDLMLRNGADETTLNGRETWELHRSREPSSSKDEYMQTPIRVLDNMEYWPKKDSADEENVTCSLEEIDRVRLLLARAPNDRAWRRRSWLVMLRSRTSKVGEGELAGCAGSKAPRLEIARRVETGFEAVVKSLVKLEPEGVFRNVVGFL